jgi:anti-sigma factor RsiW
VICPQSHNIIHAFLDGELDLVRQIEIEHHLAECPTCARDYRGLRSLRETLDSEDRYFRAPTCFVEHYRASVRPLPQSSRVRPAPLPWLVLGATLAAGVALVAGGLGLLLPVGLEPPPDAALVQQVVACHVQALVVEHLCDVASSDSHTIEAWLQKKMNFVPSVPDLSHQNFMLLGGRLDYLDGQPVAAVVYLRREHVIHLFLWPALHAPDRGASAASRQGYSIFHWVHGEMNGCAVSDLNTEELREFARLAGG